MCKKKTIFKNFHRPFGLPAFLSNFGWIRKGKAKDIQYKVTFYENCAYDLGDEDQYDWNKLFGALFGILGIHRHSIRFGWRYSLAKQKVEICSIIYDSTNTEKPIQRDYLEYDANLNSSDLFRIKMVMDKNKGIKVNFIINDRTIKQYNLGPCPHLRFGAGFYFGGNKRAPHKIVARFN